MGRNGSGLLKDCFWNIYTNALFLHPHPSKWGGPLVSDYNQVVALQRKCCLGGSREARVAVGTQSFILA